MKNYIKALCKKWFWMGWWVEEDDEEYVHDEEVRHDK
jgi:hypothetical protein